MKLGDFQLDGTSFQNLCSNALSQGAKIDGYSLFWNAAPHCENPVQRVFYTMKWQPLGEAMKRTVAKYGADPITKFFPPKRGWQIYRRFAYVDVKCRKCGDCLKRRSNMWAARAQLECDRSVRTWWCTYTIAPEHRLRISINARRKKGNEDFPALYSEISKLFTLYLKRVRKESGVPLRFILVAEQHQDGFPHLHAFIHEPTEGMVTKRVLQGQWPYGFTCVKLTDKNSSRSKYVTKYLSKQAIARVRASLRYGTSL